MLIKLLYVAINVGLTQENLIYMHLLNTTLAILDNTIRKIKYINTVFFFSSDFGSLAWKQLINLYRKLAGYRKESETSIAFLYLSCIRQNSCAFHTGSHTCPEAMLAVVCELSECCQPDSQVLSILEHRMETTHLLVSRSLTMSPAACLSPFMFSPDACSRPFCFCSTPGGVNTTRLRPQL